MCDAMIILIIVIVIIIMDQTNRDLALAMYVVLEKFIEAASRETQCPLPQRSKLISKFSSLRNLDVFLDDFGLIRSLSRLQNAQLSFEFRSLIVIPAKCNFI